MIALSKDYSKWVPEPCSLSKLQSDLGVRDTENGEYQLIFTSPEKLEQNNMLGEVLDSKKFRSRLLALNFDEAHCIYQWRRKACDRLSFHRARLPPHVVLFARSATLTPDMFNNVLDRLSFRSSRTKISSVKQPCKHLS